MEEPDYGWKDRQRARRKRRPEPWWSWFGVVIIIAMAFAVLGLIEETILMDRNHKTSKAVRDCLWRQSGTAYVNNIRDDVTCVEDGR